MQDRRYALLLGGFVEESAVLRLSAQSAPDAELSASMDVGSTRLTGTVSHPLPNLSFPCSPCVISARKTPNQCYRPSESPAWFHCAAPKSGLLSEGYEGYYIFVSFADDGHFDLLNSALTSCRFVRSASESAVWPIPPVQATSEQTAGERIHPANSWVPQSHNVSPTTNARWNQFITSLILGPE